MLEIKALPAFLDNYIWLVVNSNKNSAFVVDPGDAKPVLAFLEEHHLTLDAILVTHKHADHIGGIAELRERFPEVAIYAHPNEKITNANHIVTDGSIVSLDGWDMLFHTFHIPGHTLGHVAYYSAPVLFCGDTLFAGGCGRVFEGTPEQMYYALERLGKLPQETLVYCAHEYTIANLVFARHIEPSNQSIDERMTRVKKLREQNIPSLPSTIELEKMTNPFMRCNEPEIIKQIENRIQRPVRDPVETFHELRLWKNNFK